MANETFIGKVLQALDGKAEKDLTNVNYQTLNTVITRSVQEDPTIQKLVSSGGNENLWYRLWNTGLLEQGGKYSGTGTFGYSTITMMKSFSNTSYSSVVSTEGVIDTTIFTSTTEVVTPAYLSDINGVYTNKTVNSFRVSSKSSKNWYARGYVTT